MRALAIGAKCLYGYIRICRCRTGTDNRKKMTKILELHQVYPFQNLSDQRDSARRDHITRF